MADSITFVGADARSITFDTSTYLLMDWLGVYAPPVQVYSERLPTIPGARLVGTVVRDRAVSLSVKAQASSWAIAQTRWSTLVATLGQDGYLEATTGSTTRRLDLVYSGGLEGNGEGRNDALFWVSAVPQYRAVSPYWYDPLPVSTAASLGGGTGVTFPLQFPMFFAVPNTAAQIVLTTGTAPTPWAFHATGPFSRIVVTDQTTGEVLDFTLAVAAGQQIAWDTAVGQRRVLLDTGAQVQNVTYALSALSSFWYLRPGINTLTVTLTGATNPNATVTYSPRYRTAV
jgi:hypothetical protein